VRPLEFLAGEEGSHSRHGFRAVRVARGAALLTSAAAASSGTADLSLAIGGVAVSQTGDTEWSLSKTGSLSGNRGSAVRHEGGTR
jgi:hypothetical protein